MIQVIRYHSREHDRSLAHRKGMYLVSCIKYPVSRILYPISCILYPISCDKIHLDCIFPVAHSDCTIEINSPKAFTICNA